MRDVLLQSCKKQLDQDVPISDVVAALQKEESDIPTGRTKTDQLIQFFADLGLPQIDAFTRDPVGRILARPRRRSARYPIVAAAFIIGLAPALLAYWAGNFGNPDLQPDTKSDIAYWATQVLALPLLVWLAPVYFQKLGRSLIALACSGTFTISKRDWMEFASSVNRMFGLRILVWSPWIVATVGMIVLALYHLSVDQPTWHHPQLTGGLSAAGYMSAFVTFLNLYFRCMVIARLLVALIALRRLLRFRIVLQPAHPDGVGGMGPVADLTRPLCLVAFLFGIIAVVGIHTSITEYGNPIFYGAHTFLAGTYLFCLVMILLPLSEARKRMAIAKGEELDRLNQECCRLCNDVLAEPSPNPADSIKLYALSSHLNRLEKVPTFPLRPGTAWPLISTLFSPWLGMGWQFLADSVLGG